MTLPVSGPFDLGRHVQALQPRGQLCDSAAGLDRCHPAEGQEARTAGRAGGGGRNPLQQLIGDDGQLDGDHGDGGQPADDQGGSTDSVPGAEHGRPHRPDDALT